MNVVFRKSNSLGAVAKRLEMLQMGRRGCQIKHVEKYRSCKESVVYKIPMSCGKVYIGQTLRCINTRLREHKKRQANTGSSMYEHQKVCKDCNPLLEKTEVLRTCRGRGALLFEEARQIRRHGGSCISFASVYYSDKIDTFLENARRDTR